MSKLSQIGAGAMVTGFTLIVFKMIGAALGKDPSFSDFSIRQLADSDVLMWINRMPDGMLHNLFNLLVNAPLFIYFIIVGVCSLAVAGYRDK